MELSTAIKFVSAGNGGGSVATDSAASSVATGDITMLIAGIIALLIGAIVVCATVAYRKRVLAGAHCSSDNKMFATVIAAFAAMLLGLSLTAVSATNMKAHADVALTSTDCIGTVDEQTGAVTFSDVTMTNTSTAIQEVTSFKLNAADGVTGLENVTWSFKADGEEFFNGVVGKEVKYDESWEFPASSTSTITVSATNLTADLAKSLINKDVAYAKAIYNEQVTTKYYNGVVTSPVADASGTVKDTPLAGATVTFTADTGNAVSNATTGTDGSYTLTDVEFGTKGTITISKSGYSEDSFAVVTTTDKQQNSYVGKIQSLSVQVRQQDDNSGTSQSKHATYWCPSFSSDSSSSSAINVKNIKFYKGTTSGVSDMIKPAATSGYYAMSDLADSTQTTADTTMVAKYFAICTAGSTLHCYQTAVSTFATTFNLDYSSLTETTGATGVLTNWNSDGSICSNTSAKPINFDGSSDSASWSSNVVSKELWAGTPTLNGVLCENDDGEDWYNSYGGWKGGVLNGGNDTSSFPTTFPSSLFSSVAIVDGKDKYLAIFDGASGGWDYSAEVTFTATNGSLVLSLTFTS